MRCAKTTLSAAARVVQARRGHGEDLHINAAFVHQRQPPLSQVIEPCFDLAPVKRGGAFLPDGGRRLGRADVGGQKVLLNANELCHCLHLFLVADECKH